MKLIRKGWNIHDGKVPYRKTYNELKNFLLLFEKRYTIPISELRGNILNYTDILKPLLTWRLLHLNDDCVSITVKGQDFINMIGTDFEKPMFGEILAHDNDFRYKWAMLCDNKKKVTTEDAYPIIMEGDMSESAARLYSIKFLNWAKHGGYSKERGRGNHFIIKRIVIGRAMVNDNKEKDFHSISIEIQTFQDKSDFNPESDF